MNNVNLIIAAELVLTLTSVFCCILCLRLFKTWKTKANDYLVVAEQLENEVKVLGCNLEASIEREGLYLNKIAKLQHKPITKNDSHFSSFRTQHISNSSMTEKRHRVLSLAKYGQDVDTIANTLGLPHGEVELIVNLNSNPQGN